MGWIILGIIAFAIESIRRDHDNLWLWLFVIGVCALIIDPLFAILLFIVLAILVGIAKLLIYLVLRCILEPPHPFQGIEIVSPIRFTIFLVIVCLVVSAIAIPIFLFTSDANLAKEFRYNRAISLMEEGEYAHAEEIFSDLVFTDDYDWRRAHNGYKDSDELRKLCEKIPRRLSSAYSAAIAQMEEGDYMEAKSIFELLGGYEDSQIRAETCSAKIEEIYQTALDRMEDESYSEARNLLSGIYSYKDSSAHLTTCNTAIADAEYGERYNTALGLMSSGKYQEALDLFREMPGYKDSGRMVVECENAIAE